LGKYYKDNTFSIGNTPLVRINKMAQGKRALILAKIEGRNPAYSVKCRIGASMIWAAEKDGSLKPGMEIIEPTSGNTGIALAYVAAARGYKLHITMPETMSMERRKVLAIFGAHLILTPGAQGMKGPLPKPKPLPHRTPSIFSPNSSKIPPIRKFITGPPVRRSGSRPVARSMSWPPE